VRSQQDVETALSLGYETRGFEVKGPGSRDDSYFLAKIARAALSMGNLRDGGVIVIGISDDAPAEMLPGLDDAAHDLWLDYDIVSARLAEYADPALRFDTYSLTLRTDARVIVIEVHEFADSPHLCAKAHDGAGLRKGALYVRTRRIPETAEIPNSAEMRELLDLALEKRLRAYVESAERAGVRLSVEEAPEREKASSDRYRAQLRALLDE
jgi:predicted HTH transcriptional regulator